MIISRNRMLVAAQKVIGTTMKKDVLDAIEKGNEIKDGFLGVRVWLYQALKEKSYIVFWICLLLLWVIVELVVYAVFIFIFNWKMLGIFLMTVLAGLFLGFAFQLFFPAKVITAIFGGLLGIGASDLSSADGLLKKLNEIILKISQQVEIIFSVSANNESLEKIVFWCVWLFVGSIVLCCLPAFGKESSKTLNQG